MRAAENTIEAEGIKRAKAWASEADLRVLVLDEKTKLDAGRYSDLLGPDELIVINKTDTKKGSKANNPGWLEMSVRTGDGLSLVLERVGCVAIEKMASQSPSIITQSRHRMAINDCILSLRKAREGLSNGFGLELTSEDLRSATHAIGRITGRVDVEDLLDIIFKEFCIGK